MTSSTEPADPAATLHWHGAPVATEREILRVIVGSTVHGLAIPGQDDLDLLGIYVETADAVCGLDPLSDRLPSYYVARTQPDGARSGPGDVDLTVYSLRRYLKLAADGNPTLLLPLFAPPAAVATAHEPLAGGRRPVSERTRPSTSQSVRGRLSAASRPGRTYGWVR